QELSRIDAAQAAAVERELEDLMAERAAAEDRREELEAALEARRAEIEAAERAAESARRSRVEAEREVESARHRAAQAGDEPATGAPPVPGARRMLDLIHPAPQVAAAARRLLADAWLVPSLGALPDGFGGIAATAEGRVYFGSTGELRQAPAAGERRLLEERSRRERL